jgi:hypothetical protein
MSYASKAMIPKTEQEPEILQNDVDEITDDEPLPTKEERIEYLNFIRNDALYAKYVMVNNMLDARLE